MAKTDPIVKSRRVFKDAADKARQKRLEGKNTPFQKALRAAEAAGKATFDFEGKPYAARTTGAAKQGYPSVGPPAIRAKRGPGSSTYTWWWSAWTWRQKKKKKLALAPSGLKLIDNSVTNIVIQYN